MPLFDQKAVSLSWLLMLKIQTPLFDQEALSSALSWLMTVQVGVDLFDLLVVFSLSQLVLLNVERSLLE